MAKGQTETYHGHVQTAADAIKLFEACHLGLLPYIQRRLSLQERQSITSGSVFVWDEVQSNMKRWTDGKSWTDSRILGEFLIYYEMDGRLRREQATVPSSRRTRMMSEYGLERDESQGADNGETARYGKMIDGLMKKTFSANTSDGRHLRLVSYYSPQHLGLCELQRPTTDPQLHHIEPAKGKYLKYNIAVCPSAPQGEHMTLSADKWSTQRDVQMCDSKNLNGGSRPQVYLQHNPSPSSPIITPPTPVKAAFQLQVRSRYALPYHIPWLHPSAMRYQTLHDAPYERLNPRLPSSPSSLHPLRIGRSHSRDAVLEGTLVPHVVSVLKSGNVSGNYHLTPVVDLDSAASGVERNRNRARSKSLGYGAKQIKNSSGIRKRNSWAEDQRVIAVLDQNFEF